MNERIKSMILAAGFPKFDEMYVVSNGEELEKFAELIIRECAQLVNKYNYECIRNDEPYGITSDEITKHFGVEE